MNPHSNKNIGQLRHYASSLGITMASRKKKAELLSLISEREHRRQAGLAPKGTYGRRKTEDEIRDSAARSAGSMTRAERDGLRAVPVTIYDPRPVDLSPKSRAGLTRFERRHSVIEARTFNGLQRRVVNIPPRLRRPGAMVPATRRDLMNGRIAGGVSSVA